MKSASVGLLCLLPLMFSGCEPASNPTGQKTGVEETPIGKPALKTSVDADVDFQRLTLDQFIPFQGDDGTWTEEGDIIICSGVPKGYIYTKEKYKNFTLRADYQFVLTTEQLAHPEKANTGFMIAIQEPQKVWPVSLEVQGRYDTMCSINGNGGIPPLKTVDHPEVRERVRLPADQWNSVEITFQDGTISSRLNGELICVNEASDLKEGMLGLQSEGYVVRFRNLRVRRDADEQK
ncbi:3-keto-disaccharide hydrolase [Planctomicrobium sp. SH661]|uniref:3-keto-disaccharide hydrolase n=1 Tax=Planctomicrobium sp. SH661 TaxID=3448124 RepID=UPI003F5B1A09